MWIECGDGELANLDRAESVSVVLQRESYNVKAWLPGEASLWLGACTTAEEARGVLAEIANDLSHGIRFARWTELVNAARLRAAEKTAEQKD